MKTSMIQLDEFIKNGLNEFQKDAVTCDAPAILVIAGAGSGKTRVITSRIAHRILEKGADPTSIVALTFTNKAAGEMKERISKFLNGYRRLPFVGTFHSYCLLLLKHNSALLPFANFSIMDADDQASLIKKIITKNALTKKISATQASYQLSTYKNNLLIKKMDVYVNPIIKGIYQEYEAEKSASHCLDFDDLLFQILHLFRKNEKFRHDFQKRVRHLLIDEYQDTSCIQHELLKLMAIDKENKFALDSICAVGDEDQSIYSWRGATVANILSFQSDFSPVKVIKIEQNYRSVQPILEVANGLIKNNHMRNPKNLWSEKKALNRVVVCHCRSSEQEADTIAKFIQIHSKTKSLSKIAVLYRTHFQSRQIEEALIYYSIPYKIIGGLQFYERKEIKDLLAYMRLVVNPFDRLSLMRSVNCPNRGLGQKFEQEILDEWNSESMLDFKQLIQVLRENVTITKQYGIDNFLDTFDGLHSQMLPKDCLETIVNKTDYYNYLRRSYDAREADAKIENIKEFINAAVLFEKKYKVKKSKTNSNENLVDVEYLEDTSPSLENFLYEIALLQEKLEKNQNQEQVLLMTLHAAKGLEFDTVIINGLNETVLPSAKSLNTNEELEEERRLFYVGITRAQEYLLLLSAYSRSVFGQTMVQAPSRFLSEIPGEYTLNLNVDKMHSVEVIKFWNDWVGSEYTNGVLTFKKSKASSHSQHSSSKTSRVEVVENVGCIKIMPAWQTGMIVMHSKFGCGEVVKVEKAEDNEYHLTVMFTTVGQKKLLSSYLQPK